MKSILDRYSSRSGLKLTRRGWLARLAGLLSVGCRRTSEAPTAGRTGLSINEDGVGEWRRMMFPTGTAGTVTSVAFSPDGRYLLTGGLQTNEGVPIVGGIALSERTPDGVVLLWEVTTKRPVRRFRGHTSIVRGVTFSPDGRQALSVSQDESTRLWDVASGRQLHCFPQTKAQPEKQGFSWNGVNAVTFFADGRHALTGGDDGTLRVLNLETGLESFRLTGHLDCVWSVDLSKDGRLAVSGGGGIKKWQNDGNHEMQDCTVRLWDIEARKEIRRLEGHTDIVRSVPFSLDGRRILSGSPDMTIRLWDVETGKELRRFEGHTAPVHSVAFSPDGHRIVSGSGILRAEVGDELKPSDCTVRLWDVETGKESHRFEGHTDDVVCVAFSPDGKRAASAGGRDESIRVWVLP